MLNVVRQTTGYGSILYSVEIEGNNKASCEIEVFQDRVEVDMQDFICKTPAEFEELHSLFYKAQVLKQEWNQRERFTEAVLENWMEEWRQITKFAFREDT